MTMQKWADEDKPHIMRAKRDGKCAECGEDLFEGDDIVWDPKERKAYCTTCGEEVLT